MKRLTRERLFLISYSKNEDRSKINSLGRLKLYACIFFFSLSESMHVVVWWSMM